MTKRADTDIVYVSDQEPGITRHRRGRGFMYRYPSGRLMRSGAEKARVKALAVPPAWDNVWICRLTNGHLQATGRDAKARKQYRYHERWREQKEAEKFSELHRFATRLPAIRKAVAKDLRAADLTREKVTAAAVRLLESSCIRVGNESYRRQNGTHGLTTLRSRHVELEGSHMQFEYTGKSGKHHEIEVSDARVASVVRACHDLPGQALWTWREPSGELARLTSTDVNSYLRQHSALDVTAKTFRIWMGTLHALDELMHEPAPESAAARKRRFLEGVDAARAALRNTRAVCRKSYIHPAIEAHYLAGRLQEIADYPSARGSRWLDREEVALKRVLRARQP